MKAVGFINVRRYHVVFSPGETARIRGAGLHPVATRGYGSNANRTPKMELHLTRSEIMRLREHLDCDAEDLEAMLADAPEYEAKSVVLRSAVG